MYIMPVKRILTYVERLRARKRKKEKKSVGEDGKVDLREKEERLMAKARFCRHVGETLDRIFTHIYALTRIVSVVQT